MPQLRICRWGSVKLTPSHRLYVLGAILLVALTICARNFGGQGEAFPIIPLLVAGVAYLLAIREFFCTPSFPKSVIVVGLALAAVWHVAFLAIPTGSDDDIRRYVWDGRMQRLGYNPYIVIPDDPAFAAMHTDETRALNNPELPTIYPPGAQLFFRGVTAIHESTRAMRVAFVICELAHCSHLAGYPAFVPGKEPTGFWLTRGTRCWRRQWRAAGTSILSAYCCCWCRSPR